MKMTRDEHVLGFGF